MSANRFNLPHRVRGLTMIELMIALVIGLIITLAVGQVYVASRSTYRTQDALSRLQENARYAMDAITYDLRMAGQIGCSVDLSKSANVLNTIGYGDLFGAIQGVDKAGTVAAPFTASAAKGDVIRIFRADTTTEAMISSSVAGTATLNFPPGSSPLPFNTNDILVATDCSTAAVFQASNVSGTVVRHQAVGMNCTDKIGPTAAAAAPCPTPGTSADAFLKGTKVMRVIGDLYYIATNPAGQPSLYRQTLNAGVVSSDELVEGVEDMQVTYGLDTNGDGSVDSTGNTAAGVGSWDNVRSVQISLLMRTAEDHVSAEKQQYTWRGASATATDNRLRKVFTTTIALRSRV